MHLAAQDSSLVLLQVNNWEGKGLLDQDGDAQISTGDWRGDVTINFLHSFRSLRV